MSENQLLYAVAFEEGERGMLKRGLDSDLT